MNERQYWRQLVLLAFSAIRYPSMTQWFPFSTPVSNSLLLLSFFPLHSKEGLNCDALNPGDGVNDLPLQSISSEALVTQQRTLLQTRMDLMVGGNGDKGVLYAESTKNRNLSPYTSFIIWIYLHVKTIPLHRDVIRCMIFMNTVHFPTHVQRSK